MDEAKNFKFSILMILASPTSRVIKYPQKGHGQGPWADFLNFETLI